MRSHQSLTITLPPDMAQMVKNKVASGEYASEIDVIREGLCSLAADDAAHDAAVEKWLIEEVVPTYDRVMAGAKTLSVEEAWEKIEAYMNGAKHKTILEENAGASDVLKVNG